MCTHTHTPGILRPVQAQCVVILSRVRPIERKWRKVLWLSRGSPHLHLTPMSDSNIPAHVKDSCVVMPFNTSLWKAVPNLACNAKCRHSTLDFCRKTQLMGSILHIPTVGDHGPGAPAVPRSTDASASKNWLSIRAVFDVVDFALEVEVMQHGFLMEIH